MRSLVLGVFLFTSELLSQIDISHIENLFYIAMDYNSPEVAEFASVYKSDTDITDIRKICDVYTYFRNNWKFSAASDYTNISKASNSLKTFSGSVHDYSVLMASVLKAMGLESRIIVIADHSYPELFICNQCDPEQYLETINDYYKDIFPEKAGIKFARDIFYHQTRKGDIWLNLDFNALYPGGPFPPENEIITIVYP
jgi:hypothetical protein